jgi:uncharacterized protein
VVEVATAVPAFVGYTERADNNGRSLTGKPWRISSMTEFRCYFGDAPKSLFSIEQAPANVPAAFKAGGKDYVLTQADGKAGGRYLLYRSMLHFFQNGGGACYVVSVGDYTQDVEVDKLGGGIEPLVKEQEPTMVIIPEAVLLKQPDCISVQQAMLAHCGAKMRSRVAVLDVWGGDRDRKHPDGDVIEIFRDTLGINYLDFAAAYYPWLRTTLVQDKDVSYRNVANAPKLIELFTAELALPASVDEKTPAKIAQQFNAVQDIGKTDEQWTADITKALNESEKSDEDKAKLLEPAALKTAVETNRALLDNRLRAMSTLFNTVMAEIRNALNLMPPAAAMAGIYTMVDNTRGVWKPPANVSLVGVVAPAVNISHEDQEDLNVTTQGKSINAIRSFIGEGVLVWGARTLDGNSLDWRYVNVRRTMIMLEESCRLAAKAMVFEPNVAITWVTIKSMITNFLTGIWKRGGLAGAAPEDAFSVHVGLGETMTPEDILEGILRVTVLVAISRPAEFIEITFQQKMQES